MLTSCNCDLQIFCNIFLNDIFIISEHHYRIVVQVSSSNMSKIHGGEIGQLYFTMHGTTDGRGHKTNPVGFVSGFHEPGGLYMAVVATDSVPHLRAVELEWRYNSSLFNPLTWRILATPRIYLKKITVEALENEERWVN